MFNYIARLQFIDDIVDYNEEKIKILNIKKSRLISFVRHVTAIASRHAAARRP